MLGAARRLGGPGQAVLVTEHIQGRRFSGIRAARERDFGQTIFRQLGKGIGREHEFGLGKGIGHEDRYGGDWPILPFVSPAKRRNGLTEPRKHWDNWRLTGLPDA